MGVFYDEQLWDARSFVLKLVECCQCANGLTSVALAKEVANYQFQFPIKEAA